MKIITMLLNIIKKNKGGFTLIELVMTIILIGIMSVGLYEVVMFGINDYLVNENYLHSSNSMTYAISALRRNLVNAAMPPVKLINGKNNGQICYIKNKINPSKAGIPIVIFNLASQSTTCGGATPCNAVAFYKYITRTINQELVVFCVSNNINNVLYKQVTIKKPPLTTTAYPVANNINNINIPLGDCNQNPTTKVYSCNINFALTSTPGYNGTIYSGTGGVSVIVAKPK